MTWERLKAMLDEQPFKPFIVHTSDGDTVRVKSSEFAWLHPSKRVLMVASDPRLDTEQVIDLLHITKLSGEPANGHRKGGRGQSKS